MPENEVRGAVLLECSQRVEQIRIERDIVVGLCGLGASDVNLAGIEVNISPLDTIGFVLSRSPGDLMKSEQGPLRSCEYDAALSTVSKSSRGLMLVVLPGPDGSVAPGVVAKEHFASDGSVGFAGGVMLLDQSPIDTPIAVVYMNGCRCRAAI